MIYQRARSEYAYSFTCIAKLDQFVYSKKSRLYERMFHFISIGNADLYHKIVLYLLNPAI